MCVVSMLVLFEFVFVNIKLWLLFSSIVYCCEILSGDDLYWENKIV